MQKFCSIFERVLFGIATFLAAFIPLYPKFPLFNIQGTFVAIRVEDLLIAAVLGLWLIYILISGRLKELLQDSLIQAILLFFLIGVISLFSAQFITHTVDFHLAIFHYLRRVELISLLPVFYSLIRTRRQLKILLLILLATVVIVDAYALGQKYLHWPLVSTTNSEFSKGTLLYLTDDARVSSTFAGHYDLAVFLVMFIVILSAMWSSVKNYFFMVFSAIVGGVSFFVLILTAARLSFAAVVGGVVLSFLLTGKKIFIGLFLLLVIAALLYPSQLRDRLISTVTVNLLGEGSRYSSQTVDQSMRSKLNIPTLFVSGATDSGDWTESTDSSRVNADISPGEPIDSTQLGVYRSFQIRLNDEWPRALRALYKNPFLGTGYSSLGLATDNDILRSLGEVGILGTAAFGLIMIEIAKRLWLNFKSKDRFLKYFAAGVLAMLFSFILNGLVIDVFEASKVASMFWIVIGLGLAVERFRT